MDANLEFFFFFFPSFWIFPEFGRESRIIGNVVEDAGMDLILLLIASTLILLSSSKMYLCIPTKLIIRFYRDRNYIVETTVVLGQSYITFKILFARE